MKKYIIALFVPVLLLLSACGGEAQSTPLEKPEQTAPFNRAEAAMETVEQEDVEAEHSPDGVYLSSDTDHGIEIKNGSIEVWFNYESPDREEDDLFWAGTFEYEGDEIVTSKGYQDRLEASLRSVLSDIWYFAYDPSGKIAFVYDNWDLTADEIVEHEIQLERKQ